jgi:DNA-binding NtrC family response regulator
MVCLTGMPQVLLVEDEGLISAMVADVLQEHGCGVHVAASAREALEHLTCGSPCDVLFTDINLAGGVDGAVLAHLARRLRPRLPVVYASGLATLAQIDAVEGAVFIPKPHDPDRVCTLLRQIGLRCH